MEKERREALKRKQMKSCSVLSRSREKKLKASSLVDVIVAEHVKSN